MEEGLDYKTIYESLLNENNFRDALFSTYDKNLWFSKHKPDIKWAVDLIYKKVKNNPKGYYDKLDSSF